MDETTTPRDPDGDPGGDPDGGTDRDTEPQAAAPAATAEQTTFAFDAVLDDPIPFALTARARRVIAPQTLPELTVLTEEAAGAVTASSPGAPGEEAADAADQPTLVDAVPSDPDDPHDTRTARARALRRAGVAIDQIADELGVDALVVRAWVDDIEPVHSAVRRLQAVPGRPPPPREQRLRQEARTRRAEAAFEATRTSARHAARDRIAADPGFVSGLGLVSGLAEVSAHGIVLTTRDRAVGSAAIRWLTSTVEIEPARVRLLLRLAPQVAADRAIHDWHESTGLSTERIGYTRWRQAPTADAVEAMVRIADPRVAGAVAGWRDALLESFTGVPDGLEHAW